MKSIDSNTKKVSKEGLKKKMPSSSSSKKSNESVKAALEIRAGKGKNQAKNKMEKGQDKKSEDTKSDMKDATAIPKNLNLGPLTSRDNDTAAWDHKGRAPFAGSGEFIPGKS